MLSNNPTNRAERLRLHAARLLDEAVKIEARPSEPIPDDDGCVVIWWQMRFHGSSTFYTYAATKARGLWYVTGKSSLDRTKWDDLLDWIFANGGDDVVIWEATAWEPLT